MINLRQPVIDKIGELGVREAAKFFGVSIGTISNWTSGKTEPSLSAAQLVVSDSMFQKDFGSTENDSLLTTWKGRKVFLLLPAYRTYNPGTHFTLFGNYAKFGAEKIGMEMKTRTVIHEARNILIDKAMKHPDAETFIMSDDDMILPFGNAGYLNKKFRAKLPNDLAGQVAIQRIMSHGREKGIVGALYFGRADFGRAQCASGFSNNSENERFHRLDYRGLRPEHWVATGFLKIERWVIEKMKEAVDAGKWPECKRDDTANSWYGYFNPLRVRTGEDVSFCRRAAELGIQAYVDTSLVCGHADGGHVYWHHNTLNKP